MREALAILLVLSAAAGAAADCPRESLLAGRRPAWTALVHDGDALVDGHLATPGDGAGLAHFEGPFGTAVWDLGERFAVSSAFLQAGARSAWEVDASEDGVHWHPVWRLRGSGRSGLETQVRSGLHASARWLRLDRLGAEAAGAAVGELQVFCDDEAEPRLAALAAERSAAAPTPLRDALASPLAPVVVLLLLALALGRLLRGVRLRRCPPARVWTAATAGLIVVSWAVLGVTLPVAGFNVDELYQIRHGVELVDWYGRLLGAGEYRPFEASVPVMNYYGGLFEIIAELAARASPLDHLETRRLVTGLVGSLGLLGTYLLGRTLAGPATGFLAALFLLATPRFHGHLLNNPKDVPFAVAHVFALAAICGALRHLPRLPLRWVLALGLAFGAVAGIRVGGIVVVGVFAAACAGAWLLELRREGLDARVPARLALCFAAVLLVAWGVMLASWPWAWRAPVGGPVEALTHFSDVTQKLQVRFPVFFEGRQIPLPDVPRYFTLKWLFLSAPEFWLVALLGLVALARRTAPPPGRLSRLRPLAVATLALAVALPVAATLSGSVSQFDAIRHFLFLLPPLSVLLALCVAAGLRALRPGTARTAAAAAGIALLALTLYDAARLHPYEYVYFNRVVSGGLRRAAERYETDYLGLSFREGTEWVLAHRSPGPGQPVRLTGCPGFYVNLRQALEEAGPRAEGFEFVTHGADLALVFEREVCHHRYRGRAIATVRREDTPLLYVLESRDGRPLAGR